MRSGVSLSSLLGFIVVVCIGGVIGSVGIEIQNRVDAADAKEKADKLTAENAGLAAEHRRKARIAAKEHRDSIQADIEKMLAGAPYHAVFPLAPDRPRLCLAPWILSPPFTTTRPQQAIPLWANGPTIAIMTDTTTGLQYFLLNHPSGAVTIAPRFFPKGH